MNKIEEIELNWKSLLFTSEKFREAEVEMEDALDSFFEYKDKEKIKIGLKKLVKICDRHREVSKKFGFDSKSLLSSVERLSESEKEKNIKLLSSLVESMDNMELSNKSLGYKMSEIREIIIEVFHGEDK